jgi:hypothetical protein
MPLFVQGTFNKETGDSVDFRMANQWSFSVIRMTIVPIFGI